MLAAATKDLHDALVPYVPAGVELRVARPGELEGVEFAVVQYGTPLDELPSVRSLRVVQVLSAGTDWIEDAVPPWAALCNGRGARDTPVAEWVVGALLGAVTGLLEGARRTSWARYEPVELCGSTVVILGYGSIGAAVRRMLEPLGVSVVGVGRRQLDELPSVVEGADALVVLAPLTSATSGMVDAALLARMRDGALVVNAGRGAVIDTDALTAELMRGRLRAVLDVVDPEPLPDGHPLWRAPGLLALTPHHAGDTEAAQARAIALAGEQLGRYVRGEQLVNVVLEPGR